MFHSFEEEEEKFSLPFTVHTAAAQFSWACSSRLHPILTAYTPSRVRSGPCKRNEPDTLHPLTRIFLSHGHNAAPTTSLTDDGMRCLPAGRSTTH